MNREECIGYIKQFCETRDCGECYCYDDNKDLTEFSNISPGQLLDIYIYRYLKTNQSIKLYGEHDRRTLEDMKNEAIVKVELFSRMIGKKVYATKKFKEFENEFFDKETGDYTDETFYTEDVVWRIENFIKEKIEGENK